MNSRYNICVVVIVSLLAVCSCMKYTLYADEQVNVTGSIVVNSFADNTALAMAKIEAVRRAIAKGLSPELDAQEKMIITDVAMSGTDNPVSNERWGNVRKENGKLYISLEATVSDKILKKDSVSIEQALKNNEFPRLGVFINSVIVDADGCVLTNTKPYSFFNDIVKSGIKTYFMKLTPDMDIKYLNHNSTIDGQRLGMLFNSASKDFGGRVNSMHNELLVSAGSKEELGDASALTRELGVDLVIVGKVNIVVNERTVTGVDVLSLTVSPQIEIVNAATNKTMAIVEDSFETRKVSVNNYQKNVSKSLKRIGIAVGQKLMGNLFRHWIDNKVSLEIVIKNANYNIVSMVKKALEQVGSEHEFVLRSLRSNTAHIVFYTDSTRDDVYQVLQNHNSGNVTIESITESGIILNAGD